MTRLAERTRYLAHAGAVMSVLALAVFAGVQNAQAASIPDTTIPQSCGVNLKGHCDSAGHLDMVRDLGIKAVRRGFIWGSVEKERGVYDFSAYDRLMKDCKERGLTVLGCMAFANKLYGDGTVLQEEGRQGYANFAAACAARYKDYDVMWEIWNEPNTMTFWGKHGGKGNTEQYAGEYVALVKAVVPAMRKANPDCIIVAGSVSAFWEPSFNWMGFCFQKGILKTGINAWSVHPYGIKCPEDYLDWYAQLRTMLAGAGAPKDFPILNSERGYPIGKDEGEAGGDEELSRQYQAWNFVRQYMIDLLCNIRLTIWYEWSGTEGFGILVNNKKAPAYDACKVMIEQLSGYRLDKRILLPLQSPRDFVLQFTNKAGGVKLVVWTAPPPGEKVYNTQPHSANIPVEATGTLETCQIYGEKGSVEVKGGKISLTLTGAPQYITVRAGE